MRVCVSSKMIVLLIGFCAAILVGAGSAKADFTFGTPINPGPPINSSANDWPGGITADGLEFYIGSQRSGGYSEWVDIWVMTRPTTDDHWGEPVNLGPAINTERSESEADLSPDGLILVFTRVGTDPPDWDIWMSTRPTRDDPWGQRQNLGPPINTGAAEMDACISADGLTLYFNSTKTGGYGDMDIYVATRPTRDDPWDQPVNLGQPVNGSYTDACPEVSSDGKIMIFASNRPGGLGDLDLWMTRRPTTDDPWGTPVHLGPNVNTSGLEQSCDLSPDGQWLMFQTGSLPGGMGGMDIWQAPIIPIVDLNNDLKVDLADMQIILDHWGEDYSLCDIGPTPLGDGIVDIQDMIVLAENLYRFTAHWKFDEAEGNIAYDSVGDYDGTVSGNPSWQPTGGMIGGALILDGIDDYVETPFILDPAKEAFSVTAWVYCWMPGQVIISQSNTTGARGPILGSTWLGIDPSGKLMTGFADVNFGALESESVITDLLWHHVSLVYDTDTFHRRLYVDGVLVAEDTTSIVGSSSGGGLYIGASKDLDATSFFSGMIDDVRIYNQALSTKEIAALTQ